MYSQPTHPSMYVQEALPSFLAGEDPNQRFRQQGAENLRHAELLALLLGTKTDQARTLLEERGLSLLTLPMPELETHLTPRQAVRLTAALELSKRVLQQGLGVMPTISSPSDLIPLLAEIRDQRKEYFLCLYLNTRNQLIHKEVISIGSLSASIVHPREVFTPAVQRSAASTILTHNHPSGDVTPSQEDIQLTRRLRQAGEIMGIEVLDHLIISHTDFLSLKERGLM